MWKAFEVYWKPLFSPGEVDAKEESWRRFCPSWSRHWSRQGLSLVRDDFLWRRPGRRPLQMVVPHEVLKVKVHRCQRSLYSSGTRSKIQTIVYQIYDLKIQEVLFLLMNIFGPARGQTGLYAFVQIRVDFLHVVICFLPDMQLESFLVMSSSERWSWILYTYTFSP